jgi:hypothetical protein
VLSGSRFGVNSAVPAGGLLATVDPAEAPLSAVLFVDAAAPMTLVAGAKVRGGGLSGAVSTVEPYPATDADMARRFGVAALPGAVGANHRPVRVVGVSFAARAWPGASLTPVRLEAVVGSRHVGTVLFGGGS